MCLAVSPVKVLLMKKSLPSLEIHGRGTSLLCSLKLDSYGKRCQFPEPYVTYPSGSPVKKPSLQVSHTERDIQFPEPSFICLSKSLVNEPPYRFPNGAPYVERCPFPEPSFTHPSGSPLKQPHSRFP